MGTCGVARTILEAQVTQRGGSGRDSRHLVPLAGEDARRRGRSGGASEDGIHVVVGGGGLAHLSEVMALPFRPSHSALMPSAV